MDPDGKTLEIGYNLVKMCFWYIIKGSSEAYGQDKFIEIIKVEILRVLGQDYLIILDKTSKNLDKISKIYLEKSIHIPKN